MKNLKTRVFALFLILFCSFSAHAKSRVLLVVSELDHQGLPELASIYVPLEALTWKIPSQSLATTKVYEKMFLLRNAGANIASINNKLIELIGNHQVEAIDMVLAVHGSPGGLTFFDGTIKVSEWARLFREALINTLGQKSTSKLGLLYNLSCYGSSHIEDFLKFGFQTVVGSRRVNANAEMEYPWVIESLALGRTVSSSFHRPNSKSWLKIADAPVRWLGQKQNNFLKETDSYKVIGGNPKLRVRSLPRFLNKR
ncbi:MAG: hypothetical protein RJB66_909 [Pseudomonadota bacterium]|jgi:hypothetical protein